MSDTLYGITHLFFPSNSTQESIYCSTNNFKHTLSSVSPPGEALQKSKLFYND